MVKKEKWFLYFNLFLASFLALYFELIVIRYLSSEIRVFAYLKNLPLIASFFGLGVGMMIGKPSRFIRLAFPFVAGLLFFLIAQAYSFNLTHIPLPGDDYMIFGVTSAFSFVSVAYYVFIVLGITSLVVLFFIMFGGLIGEYIALAPPLIGYSINLTGSLLGVLVFTAISFLGFSPIIWLVIGFLAALPFFVRNLLVVVAFAVIIIAVGLPEEGVFWSPYYRIFVYPLPVIEGWNKPSSYYVGVNHDYHQKIVDLSPEFMARYGDIEPNKTALLTYDLPYHAVKNTDEVLIVGSGTGNDVAAALRHGAGHVDAVEIDPVILDLGKEYHPERPYDSSKVTVYNDDARAFFKKSDKKYDLIVFGYLDSHTLLSGFSSLRLDNYVYTKESFEEARRLLDENGTLVVAFAGGRSTFVTDRLFAMLNDAFTRSPRAYFTGYDLEGVVFLEGDFDTKALSGFQDITGDLTSRLDKVIRATDEWPFLYVSEKKIPFSLAIIYILFLTFVAFAFWFAFRGSRVLNRRKLFFFFLGAGFLFLETKGITELSLLFGSTWVVNSVVIAAFLVMGLASALLSMRVRLPAFINYGGLFAVLAFLLFFPPINLIGFSSVAKVFISALLVGLPVFFSGLVFSQSFRNTPRPAEALGANLLGAVVGGAAENAVMIWGTPVLGVLAVLIYLLSFIFYLYKD